MRAEVSAVLLLTLAACAPPGFEADGSSSDTSSETASNSETGDETIAGDAVWAEVVCRQTGTRGDGSPVENYFARREGASDAWSIVFAASEPLGQGWEPADHWATGCAAGEAPTTSMRLSECWTVTDQTACFVGDTDWLTHVDPACESPTADEATSWPSWLCADAPVIEHNPWPVTCSDPNAPCAAVDGDSPVGAPRMAVWPTCYVEGLPECEEDELCDYLGCPCETGGCLENLVCTLGEVCSPCPEGSPGCPCAPGSVCEAGQCVEGADLNGSTWSICYLADLIPCGESACPGDAHCTDDGRCAWLD